jgi:hypothetical protein
MVVALPESLRGPKGVARLEALCEKYGTPLQLYDEAMIRRNAKDFMAAFRAHFPTFEEFFAVKALPNPAILRLLYQEGCGFDCSSTAELYICTQQLGVPGNKIIYTSNYTSKEDLGTAYDLGVIINLDGKCTHVPSTIFKALRLNIYSFKTRFYVARVVLFGMFLTWLASWKYRYIYDTNFVVCSPMHFHWKIKNLS